MASDDTITFDKVETYSMPELDWDSAEAWYENIEERLVNLNSLGASNTIRIGSTFAFQEEELLAALQKRIDNKAVTEGNFGYGKIMKQIIGQYTVTLEDKAGLAKKISILQQMLEYFNTDERLTSEDPQPPEQILDEGLMAFSGDAAITLAIGAVVNDDPEKVTVGKVMGFLSGNFPHLRSEMKTLAGSVGKSVGLVNKRLASGESEQIVAEALAIYPDLLGEETEEVVITEPIMYAFKANDLKPTHVKYQVGDELREIELSSLIRKMKHDKAAYNWFMQHKPNGGPQWPTGGSGKYTLVISNDPFLNYTKSSGRHWEQTSCERYNSYDRGYSRGPLSDILYGNCVVFAFKGEGVPEGWPQQQPTNKPSGNIEQDPDGTLLGRQNIKWGYKENQEGNVGMGLDPAFYPRMGRANWTNLLNKALAMIVNSIGYLDYDQLRTPYDYKGHCDVGSGVGNLVYRQGTTCYTRIEENQINPDLIMAGDETIGYVAFDRLTRPIVDLNIKMILAQNPNIWAIAGNEVGIARLIRTKNQDILKFLVSSPDADTEALNGIVEILPQLSDNWDMPNNFASLAYLIAKHPNADDSTFQKLLAVYPSPSDSITNVEVLFGGWAFPESKTPYVCLGGPEIIDLLILTLKRRLPDAGSHKIIKSLLFAPRITKKQYLQVISLVSKEEVYNTPDMKKSVSYSYGLPLQWKGSWAFNDRSDISLSSYNKFTIEDSRQNTAVLDYLKSTMKDDSEILNFVVRTTRDKRCHSWLWRNRADLGISSGDLLQYPVGYKSEGEPYHEFYFTEAQFMEAFSEGTLYDLNTEFTAIDGTTKQRTLYPRKFVRAVVSDVDLIEEIGWGIVAGWLSQDEQFYQYLDLLYKRAFGDLYLGNNKFAPAPEDIFELYSQVSDIDAINDAAIGSIMDTGGLARNQKIPYQVQSAILEQWVSLSEQYEGSYETYLNTIQGEMAKNRGANPKILQELAQFDDYKHLVASNPNAYVKTLISLYQQYPTEILTNEGLTEQAYTRLWNNAWKVLNIELLENPNRMFDAFGVDRVMGNHKGVSIRNSIIDFIQANSYARFWRAGNVKKGKFSQLQAKNLYSDPIADFPLFPKGKVIVAKFNESVDEHYNNELYFLDTMRKVDDGTVFLEGTKKYYKVDDMDRKILTSEHIAQTVPMSEFFNFIPESLRDEALVTTDAEGNEVVEKVARWTIDNIVVIQDSVVQTAGDAIPSWRFDLTQDQVNDILASYVARGRDMDKLISNLETSKNMKNYTLSLQMLFDAIDKHDLWTREIINNNLSPILRSRGGAFRRYENIPLTQNIMQVSIAQSLEELQEMGIPDMDLNDLPPIQVKVLEYEGIPISYVYYLLMNSTDSSVLKKAKEIRRERSMEFIDYYRERNPPPERKA